MATETEPAKAEQARRVARIRAEIAECNDYIATLKAADMPDTYIDPYRARVTALEAELALEMLV